MPEKSTLHVGEAARSVPVVDDVDVLVCGGGPAGIAAAVAAARAGARTGLVEAQGCLGGTWTAGLVAWILDHENKAGLMREILSRIEAIDGRAVFDGEPTRGFDVEKMKWVLDRLCGEAGVGLRLYHHVAAAAVAGGRITHAILESKSGRQAVAARVFIDCSGDGDLAAQAGCSFELGHETTGRTQPMSLLALIGGLSTDEIRPFFRGGGERSPGESKARLLEEMQRAGISPSYGLPTLFRLPGDLFLLMANHEYGARGTDASDLTAATLRARDELHRIVNALRAAGGVWRRLHLVATGAHIGVREGRRVRGRYTVTVQDLAAGARHADAVCRVTFGVDVHSMDPSSGTGVEPGAIRVKPYDIPMRALIARDVDGLMMAGRCISGDFLAHSSYRVTGNAVAMGEAAGRVAARAALANVLPQDVGWAAARE